MSDTVLVDPEQVEQALVQLEKLFSDQKRWSRFSMGVSKKGQTVPVENKEAASYCLLGGIRKVCMAEHSEFEPGTLESEVCVALVENMTEYELKTYSSLFSLNDSGGYFRMMNLLRRTLNNFRTE